MNGSLGSGRAAVRPPRAQENIGGYLHLVGGYGAAGVLTLLAVLVFSRWLGPADYGRLALFLAIGQSVVYVGTFWVSNSLLRFGAEEFHGTGSLRAAFWARAVILIPWCVVLLSILWANRGVWQWLHAIPGLSAWWIIGFAVALVLSQSIRLSYQAVGQTARSALWQAAEPLTWLLGAIALGVVCRGMPRLDRVISVIVMGSLLVGVASWLAMDRRYWWPPVVTTVDVRRFLNFSWPLLVGQTGGYLMLQWVALGLLRQWRSFEEVGMFQVAYQVMGAFQQLITLSVPITLPMLVRLQRDAETGRIQEYLNTLLPRALGLFALGFIGDMETTRWIIPNNLGVSYAGAIDVLNVLLVGLACSGLCFGLIPVLQMQDRNLPLMYAMLGGGGVTLAVDLWLVPGAGSIGAAWASAAGFFVCMLIVVAQVSQTISWRWVSCVPALASVFAAWAVSVSGMVVWIWIDLGLLAACLVASVKAADWSRKRVAARAWSLESAQEPVASTAQSS